MTGIAVVLSALSVIACAWLGLKIDRDMAYFFVTDSNTFLAVLTGVSAFLFIYKYKIKIQSGNKYHCLDHFLCTVDSCKFGYDAAMVVERCVG